MVSRSAPDPPIIKIKQGDPPPSVVETMLDSGGLQGDLPPLNDNLCWFGTNRPQLKESLSRKGSYDLSSIDCCADKKTLSEALNSYNGKPNLFEFDSPLALLLYRANAELIYDEKEALSRLICAKHFESLLSQWAKSKHLRTSKRGSGRTTLCSLPDHYHIGTRPLGKFTMNKTQCVRWMEMRGELLHPGIAICPKHKVELYSDKIDSSPDFNFPNDIEDGVTSMSESIDDDQGKSSDGMFKSLLVLIASLCQVLGISRLLLSNDSKWSDLEEETRKKKRRAFRSLVMGIAKSIAGDDYMDLMALALTNCKCPPDTGDSFMEAISAKYASLKTRKDKLELLSLVLSVKGNCFRKINTFLSVSKHQIRTAIAYSKGIYSIVKYKRVRYEVKRVYEFISYLARSCFIASLPYGDSEATLSDGSKINIASICRLYSYSRIIREYLEDLKACDRPICFLKKEFQRQGKFESHSLGRTSLYLILKSIAKKKNKRQYCVDEYLGDAHTAFENLNSSVAKLLGLQQISSDEELSFKQGLRVIRSFLETGFRSHIQESSEIGAHCWVHALSDPSDSSFSSRWKHSHDYLCLQCEQVDSVVNTIVTKAKDAAELAISSHHPQSVEIRRIFEVVDLAAKSIFKFRKHLLRCAASDNARLDIQENLEDWECLLTIDFAMKMLASSALETQSGFYAKKGVPLHISHALVRFGNQLMHHVFGHIIRSGEQDCNAVVAILRHTFEELARLGVRKVTLRSDNAPTYKSAVVLGFIQSIAASLPIALRYAYSETQFGKGPCDRAASYIKRPIIGWNEAGKNSTTPQTMYEAIVASPPKGCSIYLVDIKADNTVTKRNPIPGICSFFDFEFQKTGLLARKYAGVGKGRLIPNARMLQNNSTLFVAEEGGYLEQSNSWVTLRSDNTKKSSAVDEECDLDEDLYSCSARGCVKSFPTMDELEIHEFEQVHSFETVTDTMLDTAVKEMAKTIETEECAKTAVNDSEVILKRSDAPTHEQGWAIKEGRAPRMDPAVQAIAEKFFNEHRAESKRANPAECSEMIKGMMDPKTGYYRFPLSICPTEKSLLSTFGNWENKRLRPKAVASKSRGPKKNAAAAPKTRSGSTRSKRTIEEIEDERVTDDDEEEENEIEKMDEEEMMMAMVQEDFEELFTH